VKTSGNAGALQWLVLSVLAASLHQTRHLVLGELNLAATERRKTDVGNLERECEEDEETNVRGRKVGKIAPRSSSC
jgi:hypothetical protein